MIFQRCTGHDSNFSAFSLKLRGLKVHGMFEPSTFLLQMGRLDCAPRFGKGGDDTVLCTSKQSHFQPCQTAISLPAALLEHAQAWQVGELLLVNCQEHENACTQSVLYLYAKGCSWGWIRKLQHTLMHVVPLRAHQRAATLGSQPPRCPTLAPWMVVRSWHVQRKQGLPESSMEHDVRANNLSPLAVQCVCLTMTSRNDPNKHTHSPNHCAHWSCQCHRSPVDHCRRMCIGGVLNCWL